MSVYAAGVPSPSKVCGDGNGHAFPSKPPLGGCRGYKPPAPPPFPLTSSAGRSMDDNDGNLGFCCPLPPPPHFPHSPILHRLPPPRSPPPLRLLRSAPRYFPTPHDPSFVPSIPQLFALIHPSILLAMMYVLISRGRKMNEFTSPANQSNCIPPLLRVRAVCCFLLLFALEQQMRSSPPPHSPGPPPPTHTFAPPHSFIQSLTPQIPYSGSHGPNPNCFVPQLLQYVSIASLDSLHSNE